MLPLHSIHNGLGSFAVDIPKRSPQKRRETNAENSADVAADGVVRREMMHWPQDQELQLQAPGCVGYNGVLEAQGCLIDEAENLKGKVNADNNSKRTMYYHSLLHVDRRRRRRTATVRAV
jgi:hypothetical protein